MKNKITLLILTLLGIVSCTSKNKSDEIASYNYSSEVTLNQALNEKIGSWVEEGIDCYGILVMYNEKGDVVNSKPITAKILVITAKAIKMKALESISLAPRQGCSKLGLDKGDTWWENDGDLFQTEKEAIAFLETLPKAKVTRKNKHFTVD